MHQGEVTSIRKALINVRSEKAEVCIEREWFDSREGRVGDESGRLIFGLYGMANFACIIVYMSAVSKEVGNKQYPATEMDDPLFHYSYGYSFIMLKASFLGTEIAALFSVLVYMAKRDERTYNRCHIRSLMASLNDDRRKMESLLADRYHEHTRFKCLERASRSASVDGSLSDYSHKKYEFRLPKLEEENEDLSQLKAMFLRPSLFPSLPRMSPSADIRNGCPFSRPPLHHDNSTTSYSSS